LKKLKHNNIITFYDAFLEKRNFYIVTEYANKGDLKKYIFNYIHGGHYLKELLIWKLFK